jgi:hypothetical protein
MNRRLFLRSAFLVGSAAASLSAFAPPPGANAGAGAGAGQTWIPGHIENNDPTWSVLNTAQTAIDEAHGTMTANFTDPIRHMDGQQLTIGGFLMPLDSRQQFTHFVLTRRNSSCPFCPPNLPTEAIEVFASTPLTYGPDEYAITGRFQIVASSAEGLFYRITNASTRVVPV